MGGGDTVRSLGEVTSPPALSTYKVNKMSKKTLDRKASRKEAEAKLSAIARKIGQPLPYSDDDKDGTKRLRKFISEGREVLTDLKAALK